MNGGHDEQEGVGSKPAYTDEFKVEAVKLGESIGGNKAAVRLGIPVSSLWNWIKRARVGKLKAGDAMGRPVNVVSS